jgi:hypothetical protein
VAKTAAEAGELNLEVRSAVRAVVLIDIYATVFNPSDANAVIISFNRTGQHLNIVPISANEIALQTDATFVRKRLKFTFLCRN